MPTDYTLMDASLEILLMLLAAFLLGWLFCWILKKLFGKRKTSDAELAGMTTGGASTSLNEQASHTHERSGLSASSRERLYDPEHGLTKDSVDSSIPTVEATDLGDIDVDLDATANRPRIDIPDLNLPEVDIKDKLSAGADLGKSGLKTGLGAAAAGLGGIAAGVGALKDKAVDGVSGVDLPDLDLKGKLDTGLGNVTDGVSSLKDKAVDSVSGVDLPDLDLKGKLDAGLGNVTDGVSSLKDKAVDSVPGVDLPDLDLKDKLDAGLDLGKSGLGKGLGAAAAGLGGIAAGASALKDKAVDSVSGVDLPDLDIKGKLDAGLDLGKSGLDKGIDAASSGLGGITDEANSLKDKAIDSVSGVDLPDLDIQGKLDAGADLGKSGLGKGLGAAAAGLGALTAGASALKDKAVGGVSSGVDTLTSGASSVKEQVTDKIDLTKSNTMESDTLTPPDLPRTNEAFDLDQQSKASSGTTDDLTRISGIDSQTASLLSSHGIKSFHDLENADIDTLKGYLANSGSDLEPTSWPHQAKLCTSQNWSKLAEYQSFLSGTTTSAVAPSVEEADLDKDDLKKIEGIGPFFESLLNKAGITTYAQLKERDRDSLKEIIDSAGPDYRLHEPETWPYQAGLADRGEWKKLQDYIHFMTGRS